MMELSLLSSPHEFHFVHAGLPHARHKRSVPHSRKLKTDPQVRPMIMRRVIIIMMRMRMVVIVIATTCLMLDCQGNEERMIINFSVCHFTVGSFCVLWITSNNCKMEPFMSKRLQSSSIWEECGAQAEMRFCIKILIFRRCFRLEGIWFVLSKENCKVEI